MKDRLLRGVGRKFYLTAILVLSISLINAQSNRHQFRIDGAVSTNMQGWVYLKYENTKGSITDSAKISNGQFLFSGEIEGPTMALFTNSNISNNMNRDNMLSFYMEPSDMKITLSNDNIKDAIVTGSKTQQAFDELSEKRNRLRKYWQNVMDTLDAVNKRSNVEFQKLKNWVLVPYEKEQEVILKNFLYKHPTSMVTPMVLMSLRHEMSTDSLTYYYNNFPEQVKKSRNARFVKEEIDRRKIGIPGTIAAAFSKVDINGKKLSLADYKGKYVLLDFWASWCVPCRASNPHLRKLYAQYKNKNFEIIGISDDDNNPSAWKKAVQKDGIGIWKHVLRGFDVNKRLKGEKNPNDISEYYGIESLPTKILIDPNGMIIGRYGGGGQGDEALDAKLSSIFK